jgi:hypothetical protein
MEEERPSNEPSLAELELRAVLNGTFGESDFLYPAFISGPSWGSLYSSVEAGKKVKKMSFPLTDPRRAFSERRTAFLYYPQDDSFYLQRAHLGKVLSVGGKREDIIQQLKKGKELMERGNN